MSTVNYQVILERVKNRIIKSRKKVEQEITNNQYDDKEININLWRRKISQCTSTNMVAYVNSNDFRNKLLLEILIAYEYCSNVCKVKKFKIIIHDIMAIAMKLELCDGPNNKPFPKVIRIDDIQKHYLFKDADWNTIKKILQANIVCDDILTASLVSVGIINKLDTVTMTRTEKEKYIHYGFKTDKQQDQNEILLSPKITVKREKLLYKRQKKHYKSGYNPRSHALEGDSKNNDEILLEPRISITKIPLNNMDNTQEVDSKQDVDNIQDDNNVDSTFFMLNEFEINDKVVSAMLICKKAQNILKYLHETYETERKEIFVRVYKMILDDNYDIENGAYDLEYVLLKENNFDVNKFAKSVNEQWNMAGLKVEQLDENELNDKMSEYCNALLFEQDAHIEKLIHKTAHCELRLLKREFEILQQQHQNIHGDSFRSWTHDYISLYSLFHSTAQYVYDGQTESPILSRIISSFELLKNEFNELLHSKEKVEIMLGNSDDFHCAICSLALSTNILYIGETMICDNCLEKVHLECHINQIQCNSLEHEDLTFCLKCQHNAVSCQPSVVFFLPKKLSQR
eukprot:264590_1